MEIKKVIKTVAASAGMALLSTGAVFAAECEGAPAWLPSSLCGVSGKFDIQSIIKLALYILIVAAILWSLWNVIQAGLQYSSAGEDADKKKKAMQKIISAIVGLVIVVVSFTILSLIGKWFGVGGESLIGPVCRADSDVSGAPDDSTEVGVLVKASGNDARYGCAESAIDDPDGFVCVNPEADDLDTGAIDCSTK